MQLNYNNYFRRVKVFMEHIKITTKSLILQFL